MLKIANAILVSDGKLIEGKSLYISGDKIYKITSDELPYDEYVNAKGSYLSPGFIDIHVHGGGGYDCTDGGEEPVIKAALFHAKHGVTTCIPTMPAADATLIRRFLDDVNKAMSKKDIGVNIWGAHLEGPYLSPKQCGALDPKFMREAKPEEYSTIINEYSGVIKRWTYAPENKGSVEFAKYLRQNNIMPSMGHSDCIYDDARECFNNGSTLVTHLYSAMSTITRDHGFRRLGLIESALYLDGMDVEIITDGCHLPGELVEYVYKTKGADRICLITDSMRGAGMPDGDSLLGSKDCPTPCIIEDGVAKLPDRSAFAGSVATADRLIRCCINDAGIPLADAIKMITKTPARVMGINNKGSLKEGYDADLVIFDDNIDIKSVYTMGKKIL